MLQFTRSLSQVITGCMVLFCLLSLVTIVYADENGTINTTDGIEEVNNTTPMNGTGIADMTEDDLKVMIAESLLTSMLQQSGANESQTSAIISAAKDYYANNTSESENSSAELDETKGIIAGSVLSHLLGDLGANESVTDVVVDYAKSHADTFQGA